MFRGQEDICNIWNFSACILPDDDTCQHIGEFCALLGVNMLAIIDVIPALFVMCVPGVSDDYQVAIAGGDWCHVQKSCKTMMIKHSGMFLILHTSSQSLTDENDDQIGCWEKNVSPGNRNSLSEISLP